MTELPKTMTAVVMTGHGGYEKLELHTDWPVPVPEAEEVLIKVAACGINNTDINTRIGWYDDSVKGETNAGGDDGFETVSNTSNAGWSGSGIGFPRIQGADTVGHVVAVGNGVDINLIGERVITNPCLRDWSDPMNRALSGYMGSERDGGFAQFVAIPVKNTAVIESNWSDAELATLPCSYTTAENMLERARVTDADTVLVTGASGGVGSALVQLAKLRGATVIALTTQDKAQRVKDIGADGIIVRGTDNWAEAIGAMIGHPEVTVAADVVGGPVFESLLSVMARGARYVTSGAIGGKEVTVDLSQLYLRDWELIGSTITDPKVFENLVAYVQSNRIRPALADTYPLEHIAEAQQTFLQKKHFGNLVLIPPQA